MTTRMVDVRYGAREMDRKWQERWAADGIYHVSDDDPRPKWYELTMYPYPSGDLHIGHWYAMAPADCHARFRRMQGYNVLHPMGFDAFGLPAENAAVQRGIHPYTWTMGNIENMRAQLRSMGAIYDWDREVICCLPEYYRWNQWFFLKLLENGLAYRDKAPVVWCPSCQTVLANEQAVNGRCERCDTPITRRDMEQWFLRITAYADELLDFSGLLDWPERILTMQRNWVGRSQGVEIGFDISHLGLEETELRTFTTRIDTIFGVTFMVLAPEHPLVEAMTTPERRDEVRAYVEAARRQTEIERVAAEKEKTGVFLGVHAVNRLNGREVPIFIADYALMNYGTGAVMGVPAHDQRDFEFAREVRPAHTGGHRPSRVGRWGSGGGPRRGRDDGELRRVRRHGQCGRQGGHRRVRGGAGLGQADSVLPYQGLAHLPAAVLGYPDPRGLLSRLRHRAGARGGPARADTSRRGVQAHGRVPSGAPSGLRQRQVSPVRRSRHPRDGYHGHLRRLLMVHGALHVSQVQLGPLRPRRHASMDARWPSIPGAPSTR